MKPGTPYFRGARLREAREARGLNGVALAELLGVTRQTISQYEHDQVSPGPAVMETITRVLRLPAEFFSFDAHWVKPRPRFMRSMATTAAGARVRASRRFEWLVAIGRYVEGLVKLPSANLPRLDVPSNIDDITDEFIEGAAEGVRRHWKLGDGPLSNIVWLLENNGVVIGQSRLWADKLDALSDWDEASGSRPYFMLGLDKRSAVRSRFDAAHELAHAILHRNVDRAQIFKSQALFQKVETQAHRFAGAFMLPARPFESDFYIPTLDALLALKPKWKASIAMMTTRAGHLGLLSEEQVRFFYINIGRRKWRDREPLDDTMPAEQPRLLKRSIELLIENGVQSREQILGAIPVAPADIEEMANLEPGYLTQIPEVVSLRQVGSGNVVAFKKPE
jgi:Zn-dependent peptidase ImmA (M78 family)/transcriptional regulator with XRE-family HTH domain